MKKLGLIIVSCIFSLLSVHTTYAQEQDKLLQLLKQELAADMQELQKQENPPYHMNFRVMDDRTVNISSSFGATMMSVEQHSRSMVPQIRVGDTILDNFKYNAMGAPADQRGNVRVAYLGLDDEKKYAGMGVSACATCDGFFYRKKVVAVVGGGDTACEEAIYLAGLASKVYLVVRKSYLRASKIMQERVMKHDKIEVLFEHNAVGLFGENGVEGVNLVKRWGEPDEERYSLPIDGFFLAIGHKPNSEVFKPYIATDEVGYIITEGDSPRTQVPGVFAAGDVADPHYRQAITAAGSGCKAAIEAERYLSEKGLI